MSLARIKSRIDQLEAAAGSKNGAVRVLLVRGGEDADSLVAAARLSAKEQAIVVRFVGVEGGLS